MVNGKLPTSVTSVRSCTIPSGVWRSIAARSPSASHVKVICAPAATSVLLEVKLRMNGKLATVRSVVGVSVTDKVAVMVAVPVGSAVKVRVAVGVEVVVVVAVGVGVKVSVGVGVNVRVLVGTKVAEGVRVVVGLGKTRKVGKGSSWVWHAPRMKAEAIASTIA